LPTKAARAASFAEPSIAEIARSAPAPTRAPRIVDAGAEANDHAKGLDRVVRALLGICGVVLLLPGACSLVFMAVDWPNSSHGPNEFFEIEVVVWVVSFAISLGGFFMIWRAIKT
jgi:hypothetical protein